MRILCWFKRHKWLYWREDANYRYCKRCNRWEYLYSFTEVDMWLATAPKLKKR